MEQKQLYNRKKGIPIHQIKEKTYHTMYELIWYSMLKYILLFYSTYFLLKCCSRVEIKDRIHEKTNLTRKIRYIYTVYLMKWHESESESNVCVFSHSLYIVSYCSV